MLQLTLEQKAQIPYYAKKSCDIAYTTKPTDLQGLESDFSELRKMLLIDSLERILDWYRVNAPDY